MKRGTSIGKEVARPRRTRGNLDFRRQTAGLGIRYIDELVCRDDATPLRLYATQDANFNVTALVDTSANVKQRFIYEPYGTSTVLTAAWASTTDAYGWNWRIRD